MQTKINVWNEKGSPTDHTMTTLANKENTFFQNALEIYTYSEAEWCLKHDVAFSFSLI